MIRLSELAENRGYFQYRRQLLESSGVAVIAAAVREIQAVRFMQGWGLAPQDLRHTHRSSLSDSAAPTVAVTGASSDAQSQNSESEVRVDRNNSHPDGSYTVSATVPSHPSLL
jgi:hypothetical protein